LFKKECFTWNIRKEMAIVKIGGVKKRKMQKSEASKRKGKEIQKQYDAECN